MAAKGVSRAVRAHTPLCCLLLGVLLLASVVLGIAIGPVTIPFDQVWRVMAGRLLELAGRGDLMDLSGIRASTQNIVWYLRAPRVLLGMLVGAALSGVNYIRLILTNSGQTATALTVAAALFVTVLLAKTVGGVLPMAAKFCKADPAIMAAPLITTIVDAISLVVYFNIASVLLPIR